MTRLDWWSSPRSVSSKLAPAFMHRARIRSATLLLSLTAAACSSSSSSQTTDLLLSRVQIALVSGGSETVSVLDPAGFQASGTYSATSSDETVATVTATGNQVTVTGVGLGRTTVHVSGSGGSHDLPVQIYDPRVLETDELMLAFTDSFTASGMVLECEQDLYPCAWGWQPVAPEGYWTFGTYYTKVDGNLPVVDPNGSQAAMVVKPKSATAIVAATSWDNLGGRVPLYRPVCPDGYKALGHQDGNANEAWRANFACVRSDLTSPGSVEQVKQGDAPSWWTIWKIVAQDPPAVPGSYFPTGSEFVSLYYYANPSIIPDPAANVLKVNFGLLDEAPPQIVVPHLTSLTSLQGMENNRDTAPTLARAMLVPCTAVSDAYWPDIPTRIAQSPFYRLEQQVFYRLKKFFYNQTSLVQEPYFELTKGVSDTETTRFSTETGVTVSFQAGVKLKVFEGSVTTSLSLTFGYSTETSVQEFQSETTHIPFAAAPGKATAVWQQYNRFVLYRHNGKAIEQVAAPVEIGTDTWVVDEYPK
jgi:hypothetical protein